MKFNKSAFSVLVFSLAATSAMASDELNQEINDLQVQIVTHPIPQKKKQGSPKTLAQQKSATKVLTPLTPPLNVQNQISPQPYRHHATLVADNTDFVPTDSTTDNNNIPASPSRPRNRSQRSYQTQSTETKFLRRIDFMPALAISSFDGSGTGALIPGGTSNPYSFSPSGFILADLDFGIQNIYLESGFMFAQLGSGTGYGLSGQVQSITSEKVTLTYAGIPVNAKWIFNGEGRNSLFIKAGAIPSFLVAHSYTSTGVNSEYRFGGYNLFDLLMDAGVGYDFKLFGDFHLKAEVSVYQGIMPVLTNYSVYNFGVIPSVGISYML